MLPLNGRVDGRRKFRRRSKRQKKKKTRTFNCDLKTIDKRQRKSVSWTHNHRNCLWRARARVYVWVPVSTLTIRFVCIKFSTNVSGTVTPNFFVRMMRWSAVHFIAPFTLPFQTYSTHTHTHGYSPIYSARLGRPFNINSLLRFRMWKYISKEKKEKKKITICLFLFIYLSFAVKWKSHVRVSTYFVHHTLDTSWAFCTSRIHTRTVCGIVDARCMRHAAPSITTDRIVVSYFI